jgi:hypothetical protein
MDFLTRNFIPECLSQIEDPFLQNFLANLTVESLKEFKVEYSNFVEKRLKKRKNKYFDNSVLPEDIILQKDTAYKYCEWLRESVESLLSISEKHTDDKERTKIKDIKKNRIDLVQSRAYKFLLKLPFKLVDERLGKEESKDFKKLITKKCAKNDQKITQDDLDKDSFIDKMDDAKIQKILEYIEQAFFEFVVFFAIKKTKDEYDQLFSEFIYLILKDQGRRTKLTNAEKFISQILSYDAVTDVIGLNKRNWI